MISDYFWEAADRRDPRKLEKNKPLFIFIFFLIGAEEHSSSSLASFPWNDMEQITEIIWSVYNM